MSNSSSSLKIFIAGALTIPSAIHANDPMIEQFRHTAINKPICIINDVATTATESITKVYNQKIDILDMAKMDLQKANLNIVAIENYIENDEELGNMKIVDIFVEKNQHSLKEIVALNMKIINKYSLFENKIIFMVYAV